MITTIPAKSEIIVLEDKILKEMDKDGTLYLRNGSTLEKSEDWGVTFTSLNTFSDVIRRVAAVDDNTILVITNDGEVYKSNEAKTSFTNVHTLTGVPADWGGFDTCDNIALISEYTGSSVRKVYLSIDFGQTWTTMVDFLTFLPQPNGMSHIHDVRYDPYEGLIWVVCGDGLDGDMVFFTDNFGASWQELASSEFRRYTAIIPFPDEVYFGTDEFFELGLDRHVRPETGTSQSDVIPDRFWRRRWNTEDIAPFNWASTPAIVYNVKYPLVVFGHKMAEADENGPTAKIPTSLFAMDSRKRVYTLWTEAKLPDAQTRAGILSVYGPTSDGVIAADLRALYPDGNGIVRDSHILKITL